MEENNNMVVIELPNIFPTYYAPFERDTMTRGKDGQKSIKN